MPIHTLADLNAPELINPEPVTDNLTQYINTTYNYTKTKKWRDTLTFWIGIKNANEDVGCILPTFIDRDTKKVAKGIKFKWTHPVEERWNNSKMVKWVNTKKIDKMDIDIGVLISGGIGCLDFDCEKHYKWFVAHFNIPPNTYLISKRTGKRSHGCDCEGDEESYYHLYFERDDFFNSKRTRVDCIKDIEDKELLHIDFLRDSFEGTPHLVKEYGEGGGRKVIDCPTDFIIKPLSPEICSYFNSHWNKTKREGMEGERNLKFLDLAENIPYEKITGKDMESIVRDMVQVGIDKDIILAYSLKVRAESPYKNRIGSGPTSEYTDNDHELWIKGICDTTKKNGKRQAFTINKMSKELNPAPHMTITAKWLNVFGRQFDVGYLKDLQFNGALDANERGKMVLAYYNHFFIITTGMTVNAIYKRDYDEKGNICKIHKLKDKSQFIDWCGIEMICYENGKACDTAKWWFEQKDITYDKVDFIPFGIKPSANDKVTPSNVFNTFEGFAMKFVPNYNKGENDILGDRINKHFREVICWDEDKGLDGINEKFYNAYRAWLYHTIVLGKKANVGIVHFSKQQGTGKSSWTDGLQKYVFGEHVSMTNSSFNHTVKSNFTDWMVENILTVFEEMPENSGGDNETKVGWQTFKSLITDSKCRGEQKFVGAESMEIFINFLFNSNNFYAIPKFMLLRRMLVNRCNPKYVGVSKHFTELYEAIDTYDGWENFIHRYIIQQYGQFSMIKVGPIDGYMVDTKYRRQILARGEDAMIYFFKDILDGLADPKTPEDPYGHCIGKQLTLSKLQENYKIWLQINRSDTPYDYKDDINKFEKKITEKFEIAIRAADIKKANGVPLTEGTPVVHTPVMSKNRIGKCIIIDEQTIKLIQDVVKHKAQNTENPVVFDNEEEYEENEIDLEEILAGTINGFLPENNLGADLDF